MMELLLSLVRSALYGIPLGDDAMRKLRAMGEEGWNSLIDMAARQTVSGLLYQALEQCEGELSISEDTAFRLVSIVNDILARNAVMAEAERSVLDMFSSRGLHPVVMKGSTCSKRYPRPELRECGDVDIFFEGDEFAEAAAILDKAGLEHSKSPDSSVVFSYGDCVVELHGRYFDLHVPSSCLPPVPSAEAEILMLSAHILKHACGAGVGLRQICDFALVWNQYQGDRDSLERLFSEAGLLRWHRLLVAFIEGNLTVSPSRKGSGKGKLIRIMESGGNFGHYNRSRGRHLHGPGIMRKLDTACLILSRLPFSLRYAPRETFFLVRELVTGNISR